MKAKRKYLIVIIFILVEFVSTFLVFNFTTRTRKPNEIYEFEFWEFLGYRRGTWSIILLREGEDISSMGLSW